MINGLQKNLKDAIEYAGINIQKSDCLWQYPDIIKKNLVAKTINNINLLGKDIITVSRNTTEDEIIYNISTIYDTAANKRPNYALPLTEWGDKLTVDSIFNDLFTNILPEVKGIHAGDISMTNGDGIDTKYWNNTLFNKTGSKSGLNPNSKYLRLYLTSQAEPIYIYISSAISDITGGYNIKNSDTVRFDIDENNNSISAHVECISIEQINNIN